MNRTNKGREVELQKNATHIQWRYAGASNWINLVALSEITGGGGGSVSWGAILGNIVNQTDLQAVLNSKAGTVHTHNLNDLTEKSYNSLTQKPDLTSLHSHGNMTALNNVSGTNTGDQDLSGKADVSHTHTKSQITDFSHTHPQSEITNLVTDLSGKQATLVSGTNIKTINGATVLGSGDLTVSGSVPRTADGAYLLQANDTLAQNYLVNKVTKLTVTAARTLTTTVPPAGSEAFTIIQTSGTSSFVITFGTGFKPTATLATGTANNRVFVIHWISDGVNLYEAGRTGAMVA